MSSQVVCNREYVLNVCNEGLEKIRKDRIFQKEQIIKNEMKLKKYWFFGRTLNREEAMKSINREMWHSYHFIDGSFSEAENLFYRLRDAISASTNKTNVLLSAKDAQTIYLWGDE